MKDITSHIQLDFRSNEPLYIQIVRHMEQLVAHGDLSQGDQLPTVRQMATELRINFNTVARAYRILDESKLISTQRGRGTYIWKEPTEETMKLLKKKSLEELARSYLNETLRLGYSLEDALEELKRIQTTGTQTGTENQEPKEL